jgi:A/G-specific adenine glycosylase
LPWRRTRDPYAVWISEVMLQQTQVQTVIPYWERWMRRLPDIATLAAAPVARVLKLWEGLGYYRRARYLHEAASLVVLTRAGVFPRDYADVLALPGIGRYTAGAICSLAYDTPYPVLDGNVKRVLSRLYRLATDGVGGATETRLWKLAQAHVDAAQRLKLRELKVRRALLLPPGPEGTGNGPLAPDSAPLHYCSHLNQGLMELGAVVCLPRNPRCSHCPVGRLCEARQHDQVDQFPTPGPRSAPTPRTCLVLILESQHRFLIRRRAAADVNGLLWEFPSLDLDDAGVPKAAWLRQYGLTRSRWGTPWVSFNHTITRYRIRLNAYRICDAPALPRPLAGHRWVTVSALSRLPFPAAHRRLANRLSASASGSA